MDEELDVCQLDSFLCRHMTFGLLVSSSSTEAMHCFLNTVTDVNNLYLQTWLSNNAFCVCVAAGAEKIQF